MCILIADRSGENQMDAKRFVTGTLVGGVTVLATGTRLFSIAPVRAFLAYAMNAGSRTCRANAHIQDDDLLPRGEERGRSLCR